MFCVYMSILYGICTGFGIETYRGFLFIMGTFWFLYWSVLSTSLFREHLLLRWIPYVQYGVVALYVLYESRQVLRGAKGLWNLFLDSTNTTFHRNFSYIANVNEATVTSDIIIFTTIALLLYSGILLLNPKVAKTVLFTMPVMGFILLFAPNAVHGDFFMYLAGITALFFLEQYKEKMMVIAFFMFTMMALIFELYPSTELFGDQVTTIRQGLIVLVERWNQIANGQADVFTLNFGEIKNEATKKQTTDVYAWVTTDIKPKILYLRSYTGSMYQDGRWNATKEGINPENLLENSEELLKSPLMDSSNLSVGTWNVRYSSKKKQSLMFYYPLQSEEKGKKETTGRTLMTLDYERLLRESESLDIEEEEKKEQENIYEKRQKETKYIPKKLKSYFKKEASSFYKEGDSGEEVVRKVKQYLKQNYTYVSSAGIMPKKDDPTSYFLLESKRGNCFQYASAAVFLFRQCGIPSRYAEGYALKQDDFQSATLTGGKMILPVRDENVYAWVEIYAKGIGWVPIDVSPNVSAITASDAREIELPSMPKITMSLGELIVAGAKLFGIILLILLVRVMGIHLYWYLKKKNMSGRERVLFYAKVWEEYGIWSPNKEVDYILERARYSNHAISKEEETLVHDSCQKVKWMHRKHLPVYMNLFDIFLACKDVM